MSSPSPVAGAPLAPGRVVERYVVEAAIGSGGMATVYRVRHGKLGGTYALKVLTTPARSIRARLLTEGRAQSALRHPNVVAVHDVVEVDGAPGLVMDHVDGPTLAELLEQGPLTLEQCDRIGRDVLRGVAAAHRAGFVHRDLKPANVLMAITEDGLVAKVADFGLAKVVDEDGGHGATRSGATMGTPAYMAPEQIRDASRVDERADVFALGALLYELVTGRRAFGGLDTLDLFTRIASGEYTPVRAIRGDVPERMERAIDGALKVDLDERTPSVEALLRAWTADAGSIGDGPAWAPDALERARALRAKRDDQAKSSSSTFDVAAIPSQVAPPAAPARRWPVVAGVAVVAACAAALAAWYRAPAPALEAYVPTIERITREPGYQVEPALSPDGKQVVYTDATDLWLRRTGGGGGAVNLTADFEPRTRHPAWSPDGERLAFTGDGALYVMGALGENPRKLVDLGFMPTWSPDGRQIAFCTEDVWDLRTRTSYQSTLRVVDVVTGEVRDVLTRFDPVEPAWSPSGEWIAFAGGFGLGLVRADGSDVHMADTIFVEPAWAPDGRSVWGIRDRGDASEVVRVAVDERTGRTSGEPTPAFPIAIGMVRNLSISADGRRIALDTVDRSAQILAVPIDPATGEAQGSPRQVTRGTDAYTSPSVSPDGRWLAYASESFHEDLYVARVDGTAVRQLSSGETYSRGPVWSPDGRTLAFYGRRAGELGIWTVNAEGGELKRLGGGPEGVEAWLPLWSPDGTRLAISLENRQPLVVRLDQPWDAQVTVSRPENDGWIATSWSPDGRWIAVSTAAGRIGRMDPDTLAIEPLIDDGYYPTWMPDGRHLLVGVEDRVFALDVETREARDVLSLAPARIPQTPSLAVSPDGATLFVATAGGEGDVWVVDLAPAGR